MSDVTQASSTLLTHQAHTHSLTDVSVVGPEVVVKSFYSADIDVFHANVETDANVTGVDYILQGRKSLGADVNEDWADLWTFSTGTTAAVASEITGSEAAGETTIAVDANPTAAFLRGIRIYIQDTGVVTAGEWGRCSHSATAGDIVTLMDGLTNAKDAADTIWTQAENFSGSIPLSGISYVRMIMLHTAATGADIEFKAEMIAFTDDE